MITMEPEDQEMLLVQNSEARCLKLRAQIIFNRKSKCKFSTLLNYNYSDMLAFERDTNDLLGWHCEGSQRFLDLKLFRRKF